MVKKLIANIKAVIAEKKKERFEQTAAGQYAKLNFSQRQKLTSHLRRNGVKILDKARKPKGFQNRY